MKRNNVDVENSIIEMRKVGTVLRAFSNQEYEFFNSEDSQRAMQTVQELFNEKFENLENAFYGIRGGL